MTASSRAAAPTDSATPPTTSTPPGSSRGIPGTPHGSADSADLAQIVSPDPDARTRDRVLSAVLEHGPVSAAELGDGLGFTPAAMRRHLDSLSQDGLIEVKRVRSSASGAGRPARRYVLSKRGQSTRGNDYLDIATAALTSLGEAAGPEAIEEFARARFAGMEERYRPIVEAAGPDLEARSRALAGALSADGFVGSTTTVGAAGAQVSRSPSAARSAMLSVQLCQGHCPIQGLASSFPTFCDQEAGVFARLLGVDVRRLSTLASGGHVCTTHIPLGRAPVTGNPSENSATHSIHQQGRP